MDVEALRAIVGDDAVSTDAADLREHAHDWWPLSMLRMRRGEEFVLPECVVRPADAQQTAAILAWAQLTRTPVVAFGGGSGVCGG
ncbi:MAG: FAD-binding protein, partial [Actinomycetota bacterium]